MEGCSCRFLNWIRKKYNIDFVDVVTAAGIDRRIASQDNIGTIIKSVNISINTSKSTRIFIVANHDCRGNYFVLVLSVIRKVSSRLIREGTLIFLF